METTAEYKLVKDTHKLEKIEQIVSEMIANGWEPLGWEGIIRQSIRNSS